MNRPLLIALTLIAAGLPTIASAHLAGAEYSDNGYTIEIGHEPATDVAVGQLTEYTVAFAHANGDHLYNFSGWIRLSLGDNIIFSSTTLATTNGLFTFSTTFPQPGKYDILVGLTDPVTGKQAKATDFIEIPKQPPVPAPTIAPVPAPGSNPLGFFGLGLFVGGLCAAGFIRRSR